MGNWNLNIQGIGSHHNNGCASDIDEMAKEFVAKLIYHGQNVQSATLTYGGEENILNGSKPSNKTVKVIINSKNCCINELTTYREIVSVIGFSGNPTVTYSKAKFNKSGILTDFNNLWVQDGTIIECIHTGNA